MQNMCWYKCAKGHEYGRQRGNCYSPLLMTSKISIKSKIVFSCTFRSRMLFFKSTDKVSNFSRSSGAIYDAIFFTSEAVCPERRKSMYKKGLQIIILRFFHNEPHMIAGLVTDCTNDTFGFILGIIIDTDYAEILFTMEKGRLGPADIVGNPLFQKRAFNHFLTFQIGYFT